MSERIVMGVDGGNTSCRIVLADQRGQVLGYGKSGRRMATGLFEQDPELTHPDHARLSAHLRRFWSGAQGEIS